MPQKPLLKAAKSIKKQQPAKHHKKGGPKMKKGKLDIAPKKASELAKHKEDKALTVAINARNESHLAATATGAGGRLQVVKAPPVLQPADKKQSKKAAKEAKAAMDLAQ